MPEFASVIGSLLIAENTALTSLAGLPTLHELGGTAEHPSRVYGNKQLSRCEALWPAFEIALSGDLDSVVIAEDRYGDETPNAPGCNTLGQIEARYADPNAPVSVENPDNPPGDSAAQMVRMALRSRWMRAAMRRRAVVGGQMVRGQPWMMVTGMMRMM